jgi:hypothetical protein
VFTQSDKENLMEDLKVTISHNTLFMAQGGWIAKACMDRDSLLGFFVQFEYAFGAYANPKGKDMSKFQGLHISIPQMAASFKDAGYTKMSARKIEENLKELVEIGAVSKAKVTPHPRSPIIYIINEDSPHANQGLADELAAKQRDKSAYKDQAANSAKKKIRESKGESNEIVAAREIARAITEDNKLKGYIVNYLTNEGTVQGAINAVHDLSSYSGRITENAFIQGTKSFKSAPMNSEQIRNMEKARDYLNRARQMDRQPVVSHAEPVINTPAPSPTPSKVFKTPEQLKAEEKAKRDDILAEKERLAKLDEDAKQSEFEKMLADIL